MPIMQKNARTWINRISNALGQGFESEIDRACLHYRQQNIAVIDKTPEPFRVIKKLPAGKFTGQFTHKKAEPDYKGVLSGGKTIVFEAKSTQDDRIKQSVVTDNQAELLEAYCQLGALAFVCVSIQSEFFMVPWPVWRDMKQLFGRKYIQASDVKEHKIRYSMGVMFLDKI